MSTEQQVTDTFVYPCRTCGGTVQVTASMTQPHDCQPPDSTESLAARAWWAGHDHAAAEVERLRAENERISGAWGEVIQREQRQDNAHLFDMNALRAERDALAARLQTVRALHERRTGPWETDFCREDNKQWPCTTIRLLDASLGTPGDEKPQPSEPESRTWHRQHIEQYDLAAAAKRIVAWVNANGGEAELRFLGPNDAPRIAVRTSEGWQYAKPGGRIVKGTALIPQADERGVWKPPLREFTVSPVESSGSAE